ncbi:hypothetical protein R6Q59_022892 [Mikania micrantha]
MPLLLSSRHEDFSSNVQMTKKVGKIFVQFILALPSISSYIQYASNENVANSDEFLPTVFKDLDSGRQMMIHDEVFDFVFASSLENAGFVNRVVKIDGIVVMPLGNFCDRCYEFLKQSNYKIVYLRQFDLITVIAMRKIDGEGEENVFSG